MSQLRLIATAILINFGLPDGTKPLPELLWNSHEINFTGIINTSIPAMSLIITDSKLQPYLPVANELTLLLRYARTLLKRTRESRLDSGLLASYETDVSSHFTNRVILHTVRHTGTFTSFRFIVFVLVISTDLNWFVWSSHAFTYPTQAFY